MVTVKHHTPQTASGVAFSLTGHIEFGSEKPVRDHVWVHCDAHAEEEGSTGKKRHSQLF